MGKIIVVSSGKGGTGKTTTVAAVSSCLASSALGHRTLCVDFDAGLRNLNLSLGLPEAQSLSDFTDVLKGWKSLDDACKPCHSELPGLYLLSAPAFKIPGELSDDEREALPELFRAIREGFDYCLIDAPSGIGTGFDMSHMYADMAIIVTTGELPALKGAERAAQKVRGKGICDVRLLINRIHPENFKIMKTTIDDMIDTVGARLIGVVCEDKYVFRALHEGVPLALYRKRRAAPEFLDVARRITGEDVPLRLRV